MPYTAPRLSCVLPCIEDIALVRRSGQSELNFIFLAGKVKVTSQIDVTYAFSLATQRRRDITDPTG